MPRFYSTALTALLVLSLPLLTAMEPADEAEEGEAFKIVKEADLPAGWPEPGPIFKATVKEYPEYRAAYAEGNAAFWTLFQHIQSHNIPMTAPVEMAMEDTPEGYERVNMGFLYQSTDVGKTGEDGKVVVKDIPAMTVVSFGTNGPVREVTYQKAIKAIEAEIEKLDDWQSTGQLRTLGYNSPMIPRDKQYFEIQVILEKIEAEPDAEQAEGDA